MEYLNGKNLQKNLLNNIKEEILLLGIKPTLAIISTYDNKVNNLFIRQIKKMCYYVGYECIYYHYEDVSEETLYNLVKKLNSDNKITSILLVQPLLKHLQTIKIRNSITPNKDVDGISDLSRINFFDGEGGFVPSTVLGIKILLEGYNINIKGKKVVIVNRNEMIGKTLLNYFLINDCTVTITHSKTNDLESYLKDADIVITAIGKANSFKLDLFKEDSVIIDIGIDEVDGNYYGDIELANIEDSKISYLAKSIGGVGPMTIAALAQNILKSYYLNVGDIENKDF